MIQGSLRYKITPQIFNMQRIFEQAKQKQDEKSYPILLQGLGGFVMMMKLLKIYANEDYANSPYHDTLYPTKSCGFRWRFFLLILIITRAVSFFFTCCLFINWRSGVVLVKDNQKFYLADVRRPRKIMYKENFRTSGFA